MGAVVIIPSMSLDGIATLPEFGTAAIYAATPAISAGAGHNQGFVSQQCGGLFGAWGTGTTGRAADAVIADNAGTCLVCKCTLNHTNYGFPHYHKSCVTTS